MASRATKAAGNIYYQCRLKAARHNDKLSSRDGAAELLGLSESQLHRYELGTTKSIPPESIVMMADLYNAPQILDHYCKNECPIGRERERRQLG
jgi:transcriptional regulator with XRE-family HTH domain